MLIQGELLLWKYKTKISSFEMFSLGLCSLAYWIAVVLPACVHSPLCSGKWSPVDSLSAHSQHEFLARYYSWSSHQKTPNHIYSKGAGTVVFKWREISNNTDCLGAFMLGTWCSPTSFSSCPCVWHRVFFNVFTPFLSALNAIIWLNTLWRKEKHPLA